MRREARREPRRGPRERQVRRGARREAREAREAGPRLQLCLQLIKAVLQGVALLAVEAQLAEGALELIRPCQIVYSPAVEGL